MDLGFFPSPLVVDSLVATIHGSEAVSPLVTLEEFDDMMRLLTLAHLTKDEVKKFRESIFDKFKETFEEAETKNGVRSVLEVDGVSLKGLGEMLAKLGHPVADVELQGEIEQWATHKTAEDLKPFLDVHDFLSMVATYLQLENSQSEIEEGFYKLTCGHDTITVDSLVESLGITEFEAEEMIFEADCTHEDGELSFHEFLEALMTVHEDEISHLADPLSRGSLSIS